MNRGALDSIRSVTHLSLPENARCQVCRAPLGIEHVEVYPRNYSYEVLRLCAECAQDIGKAGDRAASKR